MSSIKRGLGRGLDALLGDISVAEEKKQHLQSLPIESINSLYLFFKISDILV